MTKSEIKLLIGLGVLILLVDVFLMQYWVSTIKPHPFMSFSAKSYRLEIFGVNIFIGIVVFFFKKRLSILFFLNTIVCYLIFSFFWNTWMENHPYSFKEFTFKNESSIYKLSIEKNPDLFSIDKIVLNSKNVVEVVGMYMKVGDSLELSSMKGKMYIYDNKLIGFPADNSKVLLHEIE